MMTSRNLIIQRTSYGGPGGAGGYGQGMGGRSYSIERSGHYGGGAFGVPPGAYSNVTSTGVNTVRVTREKEKKDMQDLNERFASYIEKVRFLEAQNRKLADELEKLKAGWGKETSAVKAMFLAELDEARKLSDDNEREKGRLEVRVASLEEQLDEARIRYTLTLLLLLWFFYCFYQWLSVSFYLALSVSLYVNLYVTIHVSLSLSVYSSHSLSVALYVLFSVSLSRSKPIKISLFIALCPCASLVLCLSVSPSVSFCLSVFLILVFSVPLSLSVSLYVSFCVSHSLILCLSCLSSILSLKLSRSGFFCVFLCIALCPSLFLYVYYSLVFSLSLSLYLFLTVALSISLQLC